MIAIGLMSGTSADGVDAAAIELELPAALPSPAERGPLSPGVRVLRTASRAYAPSLREALLALGEGRATDARAIARLHAAVGDACADVAHDVARALRAEGLRPEVVAMHGQTVAHLPAEHATLQLGDAARVAVRCGTAVVSDFRSADVALGGQGAPLVPFADHVLFARLAPVAVLNVGGIANLTLLPTSRAEDVVAFDTGPGNMVIDAIAASGGASMDADGAGAARGRVDDAALGDALAHPFFARRGPRSTGREDFGAPFASRLHEAVCAHGGSREDALATATALTARTIADAVPLELRQAPARLLVAGGGARNPTLLARLRAALPGVAIEPTDAHGVPARYREAIAFAILGAYRLRGLPNTLPRATGATRAVSAGAVHIP